MNQRAQLRHVLGCDEHQRIADEMSRFLFDAVQACQAALKPQADRIAIVAPASPFARDEFDRGVAELRRLGFEPVYDDSVFATESAYLAGSAELRASVVHEALERSVGVGADRGARRLRQRAAAAASSIRRRSSRAPKLFIGYSDNTSLLSWLTCGCGITALHGPMLERRLARGAAGYDERSFLALTRRWHGLELAPEGLEVLRPGQVQGPLFGGTIAQLIASLGTPYAFDPPDGCVLFLEDVNERPYRIDRMLTQLAAQRRARPRARARVRRDARLRRAGRGGDRTGRHRAPDR